MLNRAIICFGLAAAAAVPSVTFFKHQSSVKTGVAPISESDALREMREIANTFGYENPENLTLADLPSIQSRIAIDSASAGRRAYDLQKKIDSSDMPEGERISEIQMQISLASSYEYTQALMKQLDALEVRAKQSGLLSKSSAQNVSRAFE